MKQLIIPGLLPEQGTANTANIDGAVCEYQQKVRELFDVQLHISKHAERIRKVWEDFRNSSDLLGS